MEIQDENVSEQSAENTEQVSEMESEASGQETTDTVAEYEANLGYTVKGEDHTFDERLHPIITDKDTEEFLRDTFTKAHGLESVKTKLETQEKDFRELRTQFAGAQDENHAFRTNLERLNQLKDGDPLAFQRQWGLSDKWVLDRATQILDFTDNPAHAQAAEQATQARDASYQHEQNLVKESARAQQVEQQLHGMRMDQAMSGSEVGDFAKIYDQKMGSGAFKSQVDEYGSLQYFQNKRYVEPQVAVAEVFSKLKPLFGEPQVTSLNPGADSQPTTRLPNLGSGRAGGPTTKRFNTLADLRRHAEEVSMSG